MPTSVVADQHLITRPTIWALLLGRPNSRDQYTSQSNIEPETKWFEKALHFIYAFRDSHLSEG